MTIRYLKTGLLSASLLLMASSVGAQQWGAPAGGSGWDWSGGRSDVPAPMALPPDPWGGSPQEGRGSTSFPPQIGGGWGQPQGASGRGWGQPQGASDWREPPRREQQRPWSEGRGRQRTWGDLSGGALPPEQSWPRPYGPSRPWGNQNTPDRAANSGYGSTYTAPTSPLPEAAMAPPGAMPWGGGGYYPGYGVYPGYDNFGVMPGWGSSWPQW